MLAKIPSCSTVWGHSWGQRPLKEHIPPPISETLVHRNVTALVQLLIAVTNNLDILGMIRTAIVRIIRYSNQFREC